MAYEPTVWKTGDVVTAQKLNKLEDGLANVESGGIVLHVVIDETSGSKTLDKTFGEIKSALLAGKSVIVNYHSLLEPIILQDGIESASKGTIYVLKTDEDYIKYDKYTVSDYGEYPVLTGGR